MNRVQEGKNVLKKHSNKVLGKLITEFHSISLEIQKEIKQLKDTRTYLQDLVQILG